MTAHAVTDVSQAPSSRATGDWGWRLAKAIGLVGTALLIFLVVYLEIIIYAPFATQVSPSATPEAVQVSVSVASLNMDASTDGPVLTTRVITDPRIVADLFARINALPSEGLLSMHCERSSTGAVSFAFRFLRAGVLVETAIQPGDGCGQWWLSAGGVREPYARYDPHGEREPIVAEVQPLGCPQAWVPQCDGY